MPESPNDVANLMIHKAKARAAAAEAVRAVNAPPAPPADAAPEAAPADPADPASTPESPAPPSVTPDAPPAEPKPEGAESPKAINQPPESAPDRSWQALHSAEKRLAEDKKAFEEARKTAPPAASADLRTDPLAALAAAGWSEDQIAQLLISRAEAGAWQPAEQPAASARPGPKAEPEPKSNDVNDELIQRIGTLESYLIKQEWRLAAAREANLKFINSVPDGIDFALERAALHLQSTGQALTPAEGLAMAQSELIEREKQRLEALRANPAAVEALGLSGSPASPAPADQPAAPPGSNDGPPLTTLTNDVAATPGQPPVPATDLSEGQRHKRAVDAIKALRRAAQV